MFKIEEDVVYKKLEKSIAKRRNTNGMPDSGVLTEGNVKITLGKFDDGSQYFSASSDNGYWIRSSPIIDILPIENGYQISTENSIYRITQWNGYLN